MPKRAHPALVVLHWLLAAPILLNLFVGHSMLRPQPNTDPAKLRLLTIHKTKGMLIAALTLIRRAVRLRTKRPRKRPLTTALHLGIYALVLLMPLTGMVMALSATLTPKPKVTCRISSPPACLPHIIAAHIAMTDRAKITLKGDPMPRMRLR